MRVKLLVVLLILGSSSSATAQIPETGAFSVERLIPSTSREAILTVESGSVATPYNFDLTLWWGYASNPLVLSQVDSDTTVEIGALVADRLGLNLVGAIAVMDRFVIGLDIPITLAQGRGDEISDTVSSDSLDTLGIGDIRLIPKFQILVADEHNIDLALLASVTLPTGTPSGSYMGSDSVSVYPEIAISRNLDPVRLGFNVGLTLLEETEFINLTIGSEMFYRLGIAYAFGGFAKSLPEIALTLNGTTALGDFFDSDNSTTLEPRLGVTVNIPETDLQIFVAGGAGLIDGRGSPDFRVFGGFRFSPRSYDRDRDGINDDVDACPDDPEDIDDFEDINGCPDPDNDQDTLLDVDDDCPIDPEDFDGFEDENGCPDPDNDQDTILDSPDECPLEPEDLDQWEDANGCPDPDNDFDSFLDTEDSCPNEPEDFDDFEDEDGCPDPDNDQDNILDGVDDCPLEPEVWNGFEDQDGCPDEGIIEVTCEAIVINQTVYFETASDVIRSRSFELLDTVAGVLSARPDITLIRIEGHTDDRSDEASNLDLSNRRALSVRLYMMEHGVSGDRMNSEGFGESRPIADNGTSEGRSQNRRVEFVIVEQEGCD